MAASEETEEAGVDCGEDSDGDNSETRLDNNEGDVHRNNSASSVATDVPNETELHSQGQFYKDLYTPTGETMFVRKEEGNGNKGDSPRENKDKNQFHCQNKSTNKRPILKYSKSVPLFSDDVPDADNDQSCVHVSETDLVRVTVEENSLPFSQSYSSPLAAQSPGHSFSNSFRLPAQSPGKTKVQFVDETPEGPQSQGSCAASGVDSSGLFATSPTTVAAKRQRRKRQVC